MGLAKNLYRRQARYWWRRRFGDPVNGRSRELAISLRVCDPGLARGIADKLNAMSHGIAAGLEAGMEFENARQALEDAAKSFAWELSPQAEEGLRLLEQRAPRVQAPVTVLSEDEEHELLISIGREAHEHLRTQLYDRRLTALKNGSARALLQDAVQAELAHGIIFDCIADQGAKAQLIAAQKDELAQRFSPEMAEFISREIAFHAKNEERPRNWTLGPSFRYFEDKIRSLGIVPTLPMVRLLREDALRVLAVIFSKAELRHLESPLARALAELGRAADKPVCAAPTSVSITPQNVQSAAPQRGPAHVAEKADIAAIQPSGQSIVSIVENTVRAHVKSGQWTEKTAQQHRSVARLFAKVCEGEDPAFMRQAHIAEFRWLLDTLPKNWGKSPSDHDATLEDICARAQDLDDDEIGLAPGTINRHLTQLQNILGVLRSCGFSVGDVHKSMRAGGAHQPRGVLTRDEMAALFSSPVWSGCSGPDDRLQGGSNIIYDALFWVPILGTYEAARLSEICGLELQDFDFENACFHVRDNAQRRVKTAGSQRRIPLTPEVLRLGFLDYCRDQKEAGETLVFPCLRRRGESELGRFFYRDFVKLLTTVLPNAAEQRKTFHSLRKAANTEMVNGNVNDPVRHAVMGHKHAGTNEKHYLDRVYDRPKLLALAKIPIVTAHITPYRRQNAV